MNEIKLSQLVFNDWNDITNNDGVRSKSVTRWWGKSYIYYDKKEDKFYLENLSFFGRVMHTVFGYHKHLNRNNLWDALKEKQIVAGEMPPSRDFRQRVGEKLHNVSEQVWSGDAKTMQQLFHNKVFKPNDLLRGESPLTVAIKTQNPTLLRSLLKEGADPNRVENEYHPSPLLRAIKLQNPELVRALLEFGAKPKANEDLLLEALRPEVRGDPTSGKYYGETPKRYVSWKQNLNPEVIKILLEPPFKYVAADNDSKGNSLLSYAIRYFRENPTDNHREIVKEFIRRGAIPKQEDLLLLVKPLNDDPPSSFFRNADHATGLKYGSADPVFDAEMLNFLVEKGAPISAEFLRIIFQEKIPEGSPLAAMSERMIRDAQLKPEEINQFDMQGETLFTLATQNGTPAHVQALQVKGGVDSSIKQTLDALVNLRGNKNDFLAKLQKAPRETCDAGILERYLAKIAILEFDPIDTQVVSVILKDKGVVPTLEMIQTVLNNNSARMAYLYPNYHNPPEIAILKLLVEAIPPDKLTQDQQKELLKLAIQNRNLSAVEYFVSRGILVTADIVQKALDTVTGNYDTATGHYNDRIYQFLEKQRISQRTRT